MKSQHARRTQSSLVGAVCLLIVACAATSARAQFPAPEITKEHKLLKNDVGVWDAVMKLWMEGPDAEPMVSKGVERNRMLGNYWIICSYTSEFAGEEFRGVNQLGYDPVKKKFVGTWIDTMSTHMSSMEGSYDESTGEMTMMMTGYDPQAGKEVTSKSVSKHVDKDTREFAIFMNQEGKWVKSMEIKYTRRAKAAKKQSP